MKKLFLCAASAIALVPASQAADPGNDSGTDQAPLHVVITPTRTRQPREATLAPTTVITRDDIERTQAESVSELLQRSPGVTTTSTGGPGQSTSIFLRGTNSDHVLVLVNGVRYGDVTSGLSAIQDLPVGQIKRIEIVRGPRSSLYGSDAIGGVIQIFTRDGGGETKPYFSATTGRYDTYKGQIGVSGGDADSNYNISLNGSNTDGFDACSGDSPSFSFGCGGLDQPDDDGYSRVSGALRVGHRLGNGVKLDIHALRSEADTELDGSFTNQSETLRQVYGFSIAGQPAEPWQLELSAGRSRDQADGLLDGQFVNSFETTRDNVTLQNNYAVSGASLVTFGLDYRRDQVDSTTEYEEDQRDNAGVFLQYLGNFGAHELQLAGRGDDNEQFGDHATGSLTWGWDLTEVHTFTASYGTAFKAPTFNDLYFPAFAAGAPRPSNPDLEPERSKSLELGLIGQRDWGRWSLHTYETRIDDLIVFIDSTPNNGIFDARPENVNEARLRGLEAEAGARLGAWRLNANATWLDTENRSDGANAGNELPRRPEYSAQFDVDREFGRYSAGAGLFLAGDRFDDAANTQQVDSYELVNLRGGLRLNPDWRVQARVENLFDEDYKTVAFFNQPGRSLFVTLKYQP